MTRVKIKEALREIATTKAFLATNAYEKYEKDILPPRGWERLCTSIDLIGGSKTSFHGVLYRRLQDCGRHEYAIAFCGFADAGDIKNAFEAGFMGLPDQMEDAHTFTAKACETHGIDTRDLHFVGHSLGGYLAKAVSLFTGAKAVWTYNSPGFKKTDEESLKEFFAARGIAEKPAKRPDMHTFNSRYDIVGRWGYQMGRVYEVETPCDHHNMRVMIEAIGGLCVYKFEDGRPVPFRPAEEPGRLRLAARAFFDNVGKSQRLRQRLDRIFRHKAPAKKKTLPKKQP